MSFVRRRSVCAFQCILRCQTHVLWRFYFLYSVGGNVERTYAMAEVSWVVPDDQHEDWSAFKGRLCRPVRFENGNGGFRELCFALAEVSSYENTFTVPVVTLFPESEVWLKVGASFEVWPTPSRKVAVGRVLSLETVDEIDSSAFSGTEPAAVEPQLPDRPFKADFSLRSK